MKTKLFSIGALIFFGLYFADRLQLVQLPGVAQDYGVFGFVLIAVGSLLNKKLAADG